jgi:hypothetical protein
MSAVRTMAVFKKGQVAERIRDEVSQWKTSASIGKTCLNECGRVLAGVSSFGYKAQIRPWVKQTLDFGPADTPGLHVSLLGRTWQDRRNSN